MNTQPGIRLNKQVALITSLSRRESDRLIQQGMVEVNGEVEKNPARRVTQEDVVRPLFDSERTIEDKLTIAINKPPGYVVSFNKNEGPTVYELLKDTAQKVSAIGRLDKDSEGLLILSNDSGLPRFIIGENNHCDKEYLVEVDRAITGESLNKLGRPMNILGTKIQPAKVKRLSGTVFNIVLTEGKNRQIRRMVRKVGHEVISLKRLRVGHIKLEALKSGEWRELTKAEIRRFKDLSV